MSIWADLGGESGSLDSRCGDGSRAADNWSSGGNSSGSGRGLDWGRGGRLFSDRRWSVNGDNVCDGDNGPVGDGGIATVEVLVANVGTGSGKAGDGSEGECVLHLDDKWVYGEMLGVPVLGISGIK